VIQVSQKPYDADCKKKHEPGCRAVMTSMIESKGGRVLGVRESIDAVTARLPRHRRDSYSPKMPPDFDMFVTDLVADIPGRGIVMYELEGRGIADSGQNHFAELWRYFHDGEGRYDKVNVPQRKVLNGNVSDVYVGFSPRLDRFYVMWMGVIRKHNRMGHVTRGRTRSNGTETNDEPRVQVPNDISCVKYFDVPSGSIPEAIGLRFDEDRDRWIVPSSTPAS
jgi:hypothetical protein